MKPMTCKKILLLLSVTVSVLLSCEKPASFNRPIGLQSRSIVVSSENGITPVIVYSNTAWAVNFMQPVNWASLDRLSGEGNAEVRFAYAQNYGRARKVVLRFDAGNAMDTLCVIQQSGLEQELLEITPTQLSVEANVLSASADLVTTIDYNLTEIVFQTSYEEGGTGWIQSVNISGGKLHLSLLENTLANNRTATVTLVHTDAFGVELRAWLRITQLAR